MAGEVPLHQETCWVAPLPSPTVGTGGVSSVIYSTHIDASPARCLEVVLDSANYPAWNKFIRSVIVEKIPEGPVNLDASLGFLNIGGAAKDGLLLPGTECCLKTFMDQDSDSSRDTFVVVKVLKEILHEGRKGFRVAWATRAGSSLVTAERTQDFVESADGKGTDYFNKETFFGVAAYAIKPFVGAKLLKSLDLWKQGLKDEAEKIR